MSTESKTVVGALNELIGKDIIAEKFGSPLSFTDSWSGMGNKIETVENKLRTNLIGKDVDVSGVEDINGLVDKVEEIYQGPRFPEWMNCHVQCIKLPTPYYMGHKSSAVRYSTITACDAGYIQLQV